MDAAALLRSARLDAGLSLRQLAGRAATSHSTLAAYESGSKSPNVATLLRILRASGYAADVKLTRRHRGSAGLTKGEELAAVLELAEQFPSRPGRQLAYPVFAAARTKPATP